MAALSELAKWTGLLKIVSRLPLAMAVTVRVNGEPATALEGAVTRRVAEGEPHPKVSNAACPAIKVRSRCWPTLPTAAALPPVTNPVPMSGS